MSLKTSTRVAFGPAAELGALYDIRTDCVLRSSLLKEKLDKDAVDIDDLEGQTLELAMLDTIQEKCSKLEIEEQQRLSLLSGMVNLNSSTTYLVEERTTARSQRSSLVYIVKTVNEECVIRKNKDKIDKDVLSSLLGDDEGATHVVEGIEWGARCFITCEYENTDTVDTDEVKREMTAAITNIKKCIEGEQSSSTIHGREESAISKKFRFNCKSDVAAAHTDHSITFEDMVKLAKSIPDIVTGSGKGVPLTYSLAPITGIGKVFKMKTKADIRFNEINENVINNCTDVLEGLAKTRQTVHDVHRELHDNEAYVSDASIILADYVYKAVCNEEHQFKDGLRKKVKSVRSGKNDVSTLETFLKEFDRESTSKYEKDTVKLQGDLERIKMIKSWRSKGIDVTKRRVVFVFVKTNDRAAGEHQRFFLELKQKHARDTDHSFIDTDMITDGRDSPSSTIMKFTDGRLTSEDAYADANTSLIQFTATSSNMPKPSQRAYAMIRCPNSFGGKCDSKSINWKCSKCKSIVEFDLNNGKFYCLCGLSDPYTSSFHCSSKGHDTSFIKYPREDLRTQLGELHEINILILGETGVGKSTWINSFQNYLHFADLTAAMKSEKLCVLIPSSFTISDRGKDKQIHVGECIADTNEILDTGKSATQAARTHVFQVGKVKVRLIDTPGIGDTRGIEEDRKNFNNILSYLTFYYKINTVCILLKSGSSRLNTMFRYCIQELLVQLHSSARHNIVFCFTHARGSSYEPGDTLPVLKRLLREKKVDIDVTPDIYFCFDNEPFRFLACRQNGVEFTKDKIDIYSKSWAMGVKETRRLFNHVQQLCPHMVRDTICMNEARRVILAMTKPLADATKAIEQTTQEAEVNYAHIDALKSATKEEMEQKMTFSAYVIKFDELPNPRTVCAHGDCVTHVAVGEKRVQHPVYTQICHNPCDLNSTLAQCSGIRHSCKLKTCAESSIYNGVLANGFKKIFGTCRCGEGWFRRTYSDFCQQCGHEYNKHLKVTYQTNLTWKRFISPEDQKKIEKMEGSFDDKKTVVLAIINAKLKELLDEKEFIITTSAKFQSFFKASTLIPYNDAMGDYLEKSIALEEDKPSADRNKTLLKSLQAIKIRYEKHRQYLDETIGTDTGENIRTPEEVVEIQEKLFKLKHNGATLKTFFDGISLTHSAKNTAFGEPEAIQHENQWLFQGK